MTEKIEKVEKKSDDGLSAKVRKLEETLNRVVKTIESMFGVDINRDGKIGLIAVLIALSGVLAFGQTKIWNVLKADGTDAAAVYDDGTVQAGAVQATTYRGAIIIGTNAAPVSSVAATGSVAASATVAIKHGETVRVNDQTYMFWSNTLNAANQIKIAGDGLPVGVEGHTNSVAFTNLFLAITVGGTNNPTLYHTATVKPANLTAAKVDQSTIKFTSDTGYHGAIGNAFVLTRAGVADAAGTNLTVSGAGTFTGGTDGTVGEKGSIRVHGTGISFTTMDSTAGHAVWTTK